MLAQPIGLAVLVLCASIHFVRCSELFCFLIFDVSIQPYDRWGFKQNLEGEDEEAFLSIANKMDRRSEELKVNKSTENSILTAVITNNTGNSNGQIIGL